MHFLPWIRGEWVQDFTPLNSCSFTMFSYVMTIVFVLLSSTFLSPSTLFPKHLHTDHSKWAREPGHHGGEGRDCMRILASIRSVGQFPGWGKITTGIACFGNPDP